MAHVQRRPIKRHIVSDMNALVVARGIYIFFGFVALSIALRMILLLFDADRLNWFVGTIYAISKVFVMPFFLVFGLSPTYGATTFEISSLAAFAFYLLLGWGLAVAVLSYGPWHGDVDGDM